MYNLSDPNTTVQRIIILSGSALGQATTEIKIRRVLGAVNVNQSGQLVYAFEQSEASERTFYDSFFFSASLFSENLAQAQAGYFYNELVANSNAYTLEEIAFLAKTMVFSNWTSPVLMTWEQWQNLCKTNTVSFTTLFSQLTPTGGNTPPTGTGTDTTTTEPGNTGTGTDTGTKTGTLPDILKDSPLKKLIDSVPSSVYWSLATGLVIFFITKKFSK